jgi:hypothetical protein
MKSRGDPAVGFVVVADADADADAASVVSRGLR